MKKYKKQFKVIFLSHSNTSIQNQKIESEFIKYFDTDKFIEQFIKAVSHLTEKMNIDSKEENAILGLANYLLAEIKQEMLNEVDKYSLGNNDNVSEDRLSFQQRIKLFTHFLNYSLFGKNDSIYKSLFETKSSRLIKVSEKPKYEYQNYLFDTVFSKYNYLMLIREQRYAEAEELQKEIERMKREKNLLHRHIEQIEISEIVDKRSPKLKAEDCLKEYFKNEKFDKSLTNGKLAPIIINWAVKKGYKKFSEKTIRPKISLYRNLSE